MLAVYPPGILSAIPRKARVYRHGNAEDDGLMELEFILSRDRVAYVTYSPPAGRALPVDQGAEVLVALTPPDQEGVFRGEGLLLQSREGVLIAALAAGGGLPPGSLGGRLEIRPSRRVAYTASRQGHDLCLGMFEHRYLKVSLDGRVANIAPGTWTPVVLNERNYDLFAMDAAVPVTNRCREEGRGNLSYAVLARP